MNYFKNSAILLAVCFALDYFNIVNFRQIISIDHSTVFSTLLPCTLFLFIINSLAAIRWILILNRFTDAPINWLAGMSVTFKSGLLAYFLPGQLGSELGRVVLASRGKISDGLDNAVSSAIIDRAMALVSMLIMASIFVSSAFMVRYDRVNILLFFVGFLILNAMLVPLSAKLVRSMVIALKKYRYVDYAGNILKTIKMFTLERPVFCSLMLLYSMLLNLAVAYVTYLIVSRMFQPIEFSSVALMSVLSNLSSVIPITPGGVGISEVVFREVGELVHSVSIENLAGGYIIFRFLNIFSFVIGMIFLGVLNLIFPILIGGGINQNITFRYIKKIIKAIHFKMKNLNRFNLGVVFCAAFFTLNVWIGADFGRFAPDYFAAHSITMSHLHQEGEFTQLLQTIPNSASGVFPLWIYGFFEGFIIHKIISFFVFFGVIAIIWRATLLNDYGRYFIMALLLSPMMISATAWVLPEIFALLAVVTVCFLSVSHPKAAVVMSVLVPLSRQTFIVLLAGRLFFRPKNLSLFFVSILVALLALASLAYIWGGLVPPKLRGVHLTPSLKAPIIALLIFSLYFFYNNIKSLKDNPANWPRLLISIISASIIVWIGLNQPPLLGGGYIFSRLEARNLLLSGLFETALLSLFFYKTKFDAIVFIVLASLSFSTTNYMFLKYVDFYFFAFLAYGISDISEQAKNTFMHYANSGFVFQLFSVSTALLFYIL